MKRAILISLITLSLGGLAILGGRLVTSNLSTISKAGAVPEPQIVHVIRATSGDTILVRYFSGYVGKVRYIGLSAPRKSRSHSECFAKEATRLNHSLTAGQRLRLVSDHERRDKNGHLFAYAFRERDGLFINGELIRQGHALITTTPPNVAYSKELRQHSDRARVTQAGLWGACRSRQID